MVDNFIRKNIEFENGQRQYRKSESEIVAEDLFSEKLGICISKLYKSIKQRLHHGSWRDASWNGCSSRGPGCSSSPSMVSLAFCNYNPRGSGALFWSL